MDDQRYLLSARWNITLIPIDNTQSIGASVRRATLNWLSRRRGRRITRHGRFVFMYSAVKLLEWKRILFNARKKKKRKGEKGKFFQLRVDHYGRRRGKCIHGRQVHLCALCGNQKPSPTANECVIIRVIHRTLDDECRGRLDANGKSRAPINSTWLSSLRCIGRNVTRDRPRERYLQKGRGSVRGDEVGEGEQDPRLHNVPGRILAAFVWGFAHQSASTTGPFGDSRCDRRKKKTVR